MSVIVNPGSGPVPESGDGWANTYEGALGWARYWLGLARDNACTDVELVEPGTPSGEGRWKFGFRHPVTGVVVELETHGIPFEQIRAYEKERLFAPRIYWNGSSCSEPVLQDWAASGFRALRTFVAEYVTNDDDRGFVRHHWGDLELDWDPDEEDDR